MSGQNEQEDVREGYEGSKLPQEEEQSWLEQVVEDEEPQVQPKEEFRE